MELNSDYLPQLHIYAGSIRKQCPDRPPLGVEINRVRVDVVAI